MIAPDYIRDYLLKKFKDNYGLSSGDEELVIPSVFSADDYKRHMSINLDTGLWQCFKTGNKGNFIQLYAFLEGVSYNRAEANLLFEELLADKPAKKVEVEKQEVTYSVKNLSLLPVTLGSYESKEPLVLRAWSYLWERKLLSENCDSTFYVATNRFCNCNGRLIIPFTENDKIFYYQARALDGSKPKYINPSGGWPKGSHVLYPFDEESQEPLYICEGPIDAKSLQNAGINATCTLGSSISDEQMEHLKDYEGELVVAYDNDDAGRKGVNRFDYMRRIKRMANVSLCHPPKEVKDWNEALIKGINLKRFVVDHTFKYDYNYLVDHLLTTL